MRSWLGWLLSRDKDQFTENYSQPPEGWAELDDPVCSNFDHVVDLFVVEKLRGGGCYARYPGWNFYGEVWFQDGKFRCAVRQFRAYRQTISAKKFDEVKRLVCQTFGSD